MQILVLLTLISFFITDTLIRESKDSKIKRTWVRLFKKGLLSSYQGKLKKFTQSVVNKIPRDSKGRLDLKMFVSELSEKYTYKILTVFILLLILTLILTVLSFI
jgi:hypothetical protein